MVNEAEMWMAQSALTTSTHNELKQHSSLQTVSTCTTMQGHDRKTYMSCLSHPSTIQSLAMKSLVGGINVKVMGPMKVHQSSIRHVNCERAGINLICY